MPTVLKVRGFRFFIFPADHDPPHVHIFKAGGEVRIALGDEAAPPRIMSRSGMNEQGVLMAYRLTIEYQDRLLQAWREFHAPLDTPDR